VVDREIAERFQSYLDGLPDGPEPIVWTGRPNPWVTLTWIGLLIRAPLFLLFSALAWMVVVFGLEDRGVTGAGWPALLVLIVFVVARYGVEVYVRRGSIYALTHTYALVLRPLTRRPFRHARAHQLRQVATGVFGGGTVKFEDNKDKTWTHGRWSLIFFAFKSTTLSDGVNFEGLRDAKAIDHQLATSP